MRTSLRRPVSEPVTIGFVGDTFPGFPAGSLVQVTQNLTRLLETCDLVLANLEGPLTSASISKNRGVPLRSDSSAIDELKQLKINVANLANNHIMDCGLPGLMETMSVLKRNKIARFGAGRNIEEASAPFIFESVSGRLAFVGYSYQASDVPSMASANTPGARPLNLAEAKREIALLREKGYIVCATYHGGSMWFRIPNPGVRSVMKQLAEAGAHIVIGHHAHLFQGIEIDGESIIAYGLGNFWWSDIELKHRGEAVGLFLKVEVDFSGPVAYSVHFVNNHWPLRKISVVNENDGTELGRLFDHISDALVEPAKYCREFRLDCLRLVIGMNDANFGLWLRGLPHRIYSSVKFILKAATGCLKKGKMEGLRQPVCSVDEIYFSAIRGFPYRWIDFRDLRKSYSAYDISADGRSGNS